MTRYFPPKRDFNSLSVKDLLDAREAYHVHLAHLENVIATAIGRYRIRDEDADSKKDTTPRDWRERVKAPPRTLQNTSVKPWSWPCILVFVEKWLTAEELIKQDPDQVVPRFLYLPDGRVIPTCVVKAERLSETAPPLMDLTFPDQMLGGGYPVFTDEQEQEHVASVGCLVTNGDTVYALTNRHVTGVDERSVYSYLRGKRVQIGTTAVNKSDQVRNLGKKHFNDIYGGWPGSRSFANIDAGLIRVDDINDWTAQVFGIGEIGEPVDLNVNTISIDLIGCPVKAFGGASGELKGEIQALFYRYRSIGGFEYISDLLIGSRDKKVDMPTRPGDSGTIWFFDPLPDPKAPPEEIGKKPLRPIALQWGGHSVLNGGGKGRLDFALATCLSTVCRELDVEIIRDWNIGHNEYWGKTGHYKIAAKACELVDASTNSLKNLAELLINNVESIGFTDTAILAGALKTINANQFVSLADVPDLVWRTFRKLDSSNHFADMDEVAVDGPFKGTSLLELCTKKKNIDIGVWNQFYESIGVKSKYRGALPFRVWQIFNNMVTFVKNKQIAEFICAGGIISHYVGDACQALHVSHLHHGRPGFPKEERVHSVYETQMLDRFSTQVIGGVNSAVGNRKSSPKVTDGRGAAEAVIDLMRKTINNLPPIDIINAYNQESGTRRLKHMWEVLQAPTMKNIAEGCLCMGMLWASAWEAGDGSKIKKSQLGPVDQVALMNLYNTKTFLEAYRLDDPRFAADLT